MADYFDPFKAVDAQLLRKEHRGKDKLERIADEAEREAIDHYTEWVTNRARQVASEGTHIGDSRYVLLDGYAEDAADADGYDSDRGNWSGFAEAMRRTIAKIVDHRMRYEDREEGVKSETRGKRSKTYETGHVDPRWPDYWNRPLRPYEVEEPVIVT